MATTFGRTLSTLRSGATSAKGFLTRAATSLFQPTRTSVFTAAIGAGLTPQQQIRARQITGLAPITQPVIGQPSTDLRRLSIQLAGGQAPQQQAQRQAQQQIQPTPEVQRLPVPYQDLYGAAFNYLQQLQNSGFGINPNVEITPERAAEFLTRAQQEVEPFFAQRFKLAKDAFLSELGFQSEEIGRLERETQRQYAQQLRQLSEQQAESGFALSGRRQLAEQELAGETQRGIEETRRRLQFGAGRAARAFAEKFGEAGVKQTQVPALPEIPKVVPGQERFATGGRVLPLFEISPEVLSGLIGESEKERRLGIRSLAQQQEESFRLGRTIPTVRNIL